MSALSSLRLACSSLTDFAACFISSFAAFSFASVRWAGPQYTTILSLFW